MKTNIEVTISVDIIEEIEKYGIGTTVRKYDVSETLIFENLPRIDINQLYNALKYDWSPSQSFIEKCLNAEVIDDDFIYELNMGIYARLDQKFIFKYEEYINWNRMLLWMFNEGDIDVDEWVDVIETYNLWHLASSVPLNINFIRKYKDKLDWRFVSFLNDFTDEEKKEFSDLMYQVAKRTPTLTMKDVAGDIKDMIQIKKTVSEVLKDEDDDKTK